MHFSRLATPLVARPKHAKSPNDVYCIRLVLAKHVWSFCARARLTQHVKQTGRQVPISAGTAGAKQARALNLHESCHDRFVLIGLCWLYGRSEFPPPPWLVCRPVFSIMITHPLRADVKLWLRKSTVSARGAEPILFMTASLRHC